MSGQSKFACLCAINMTLALPALAAVPATPQADPLISTVSVRDTETVRVNGEVSAMVHSSQDLGRVSGDMLFPQLTLVLKRSAARQAALDHLVAAQLTRGNPAYRKWVRPEELFPAFGPSPADIAQVTTWLGAHGFIVGGMSADGMTIRFAGNARQVEAAFHTEIHTVLHHNEMHFANVVEPTIPRAFAPVVAGITLHNFFPKPMSRSIGVVEQDVASGAWNLVGPSPDFLTPITQYGQFQAIGANDFTTIYNVNPLRAGNSITGGPLTGLGTTIILLNDGDAQPKDWERYRHVFGLSGFKGSLSIEHPGNCGDPGLNEDSVEASLDIEVGSISAPDANVILATCPSMNFNTNSGLFTALENLVSLGTPAQVISVSYGFCEAGYGPTALLAWSQAAEEGSAEGLSIFVAGGDNGSAGCDNDNTEAVSTLGLAVNGLASNPYVTAVGGTDFSDEVSGQSSTYFAKRNRSGLETALSYVPEIVWNDSCASPVLLKFEKTAGKTIAASPLAFCNSVFGGNFLNIVGGGGGSSAVYPKPYWQSLVTQGMPRDGARDLPDVSLFASSGFWGHFTLFCDTIGGGPACIYSNPVNVLYGAVGGTSVATPSFAGILLLETQYAGEQQGSATPVRIGNVAPRLYELAAAQFSSSLGISKCNASLGNKSGAVCVFHNVTQNSNDGPCAAGSPNCYTDPASTLGIGILSVRPSTGTEAYSARPGYSLATGLGSVDALNLVAAY
jgi:subtilase family serine protease